MMTNALARESMDKLLARMGLIRAEGRSAIAPTLLKDEQGAMKDFEVENEV